MKAKKKERKKDLNSKKKWTKERKKEGKKYMIW